MFPCFAKRLFQFYAGVLTGYYNMNGTLHTLLHFVTATIVERYDSRDFETADEGSFCGRKFQVICSVFIIVCVVLSEQDIISFPLHFLLSATKEFSLLLLSLPQNVSECFAYVTKLRKQNINSLW